MRNRFSKDEAVILHSKMFPELNGPSRVESVIHHPAHFHIGGTPFCGTEYGYILSCDVYRMFCECALRKKPAPGGAYSVEDAMNRINSPLYVEQGRIEE